MDPKWLTLDAIESRMKRGYVFDVENGITQDGEPAISRDDDMRRLLAIARHVQRDQAHILCACAQCAALRRLVGGDTITDGFGNTWSARCPKCGGRMQVVRPGKVQCENCG